jgi:uncharacterized protein YkwD
MTELAQPATNELLSEHNALRRSAGLAPLKLNEDLVRAAKWHSDYMQKNRSMTHVEGWVWDKNRTVANRAKNNGYVFSSIGENIAWGQKSVVDVMTTWWHSAPHKSNILGNFVDVGMWRSGDYWCVVFGKASGV